jgi:hypothetical protein
MMNTKGNKMNKYTEYAHDYLSGGNMVPIGVLDSAEFKAEVRRLAGPVTPRSPASLAYLAKQAKKLEKYLASLRGPRGGLPKTGLAEYRYNTLILEQIKRELSV